jgi:hypothetical protein
MQSIPLRVNELHIHGFRADVKVRDFLSTPSARKEKRCESSLWSGFRTNQRHVAVWPFALGSYWGTIR